MVYGLHPTAYAAYEIDLEEFLDLDEFPIHDLMSPRRAELVAHCREGLDAVGCAHVPQFLCNSAVSAMCSEAQRLMEFARPGHDMVNPYFTEDDPSLDAGHPKRFFERRTSAFINSDHLEANSILRKIYDSDVVVHFVSECLNQTPIYRWAEPLGRNPYSVMHDGDYFPWHFDGNEFTVSLLVQEASEGGDFEYCPDIRSPNHENFDDVAAVLNGERSPVKTLALKTGDLQIFKGRFSMHRVTRTFGEQPRIIALPTYVTNPYLTNRPHHAEAIYGRAMPIHYKHNLNRADNLTD